MYILADLNWNCKKNQDLYRYKDDYSKIKSSNFFLASLFLFEYLLNELFDHGAG